VPVSDTALLNLIETEKQHHDVVVSTILNVIAPRLPELHQLLLDPPEKTTSVTTLAASFGSVRYELCYLFTVMLETKNEGIIKK
jgi:serine/threonine-protein phosphatase 6 regulatory subunit 3